VLVTGTALAGSAAPTADSAHVPSRGQEALTASTRAATPGWDFNNDGRHDLVIGVRGRYEGGRGFVQVHLATRDGVRQDPLILRSPVRQGFNDSFGASVASADFDRDGYDDLVVGAPNLDRRRIAEGGLVVFRGGPSGVRPSTASVLLGHLFQPRLGLLGGSVVAADFDGDGWPDIATQANGRVPGKSTTYQVVVLWGGRAGFSPARSYRIAAPPQCTSFGETLAVGDVDHDGHVDLVEAAYDHDQLGGHIGIVMGTAHGPRQARLLDLGSTTSLAVGNLNGDQYADVVAGRPRSEGETGAGSVTTWSGGTRGLDGAVVHDLTVLPGLVQEGDGFGGSVALADLDQDGYGDVGVGAPTRTVGGSLHPEADRDSDSGRGGGDAPRGILKPH
jgi:hypothetical protein